MIWSFSEGKLFRKCQRQWFFNKRLANAISKDPRRREAYLLSKLSSISAWRGKVVDQVIEKVVVPALQRKIIVTLQTATQAANKIFDAQLDFALNRRIREIGFKASEHEDDLAAFFVVEYGGTPEQDEIDLARTEVLKALANLFQSSQFQEVRDNIKSANWLAAQCPITFRYMGATVRAVPDLICLFRDKSPLIIDWKVHHFGVHDYYQQLVAYAITLTRCGEHKGLPAELRRHPAHTVRLVEAQLLTNEARTHLISEEDIQAVEDRMATEIQQMLLAVDGRENKELSAEDFPTTNWAGVCQTCNFRKLCFEVQS
ncbi:MAG: PD-(D/E)XK nuclease family protein [Verrucomicrobia bacterium]|nr:PD-(D/E)XK nuclease family protein [Verrucomicrobiota bacterium]